MKNIFSEKIMQLPKDNFGFEGLHAYSEKTEHGMVYFVHAEKEIKFPTHQHAKQWSVVIEGECMLEIDGISKTYKKGDTYEIPANTPHTITMYAGCAEIDFLMQD